MKVVNISGGLGNQMFQYAFAVSLSKAFPHDKIYIDTQHYNTLFFNHFRGINLHNGYEIGSVFPNAVIPVASASVLRKVSYYIPNYVLSRIARRVLPRKKTELIIPRIDNYRFLPEAFQSQYQYFEGCWQSWSFYKDLKDVLRDVFSPVINDPENLKLRSALDEEYSVGIHVRRGDYLNEPDFRGICSENYYQKCISSILSENPTPKFYIFTNDAEWCESHLVPMTGKDRTNIVSINRGKDSYKDMFLMAYCKALIIANSSFSWWGAYLNTRAEKVYAPDPWVNRDAEIDIYDPKWIRVK